MKNNNAQKEKWIGRHIKRTPVLVVLALFLILSNSVIYLAAFEAHVVNVTATIERPPTMCDARSIGYWKNHDGCDKGEGESIWASQIREMTRNFSGAFFGITGEEICQAVWTPGCPSGNNIPAKLCRARAMTLADELNLVSGHLDINALIAGADNGNSAFDRLGLNYNSTIRDALVKIEMIITNSHSTIQQLSDAAYVAERLYSFYEDENPIAPKCVYEPKTTCGGDSITHYSASSYANEPENDSNNSDEDGERDEHKNRKKSEDTESPDNGNGRGRHENNDESGGAETGAGATSTESEINASSASTDETINLETDLSASSTELVAEPIDTTTTTSTVE